MRRKIPYPQPKWKRLSGIVMKDSTKDRPRAPVRIHVSKPSASNWGAQKKNNPAAKPSPEHTAADSVAHLYIRLCFNHLHQTSQTHAEQHVCRNWSQGGGQSYVLIWQTRSHRNTRILKMMPPKQAEMAIRGYPCRATVMSEKQSDQEIKKVLIQEYVLVLWILPCEILASPPMLLPQAKSVSPNTVLLRLSTTPSMCRTLTTSAAAALISTALTMKPNTANTCNRRTSESAHFITAAIIDDHRTASSPVRQ